MKKWKVRSALVALIVLLAGCFSNAQYNSSASGNVGTAWAEESPENETDIALCDLLICANNSMRSLLCLFIKYVRISSGMP